MKERLSKDQKILNRVGEALTYQEKGFVEHYWSTVPEKKQSKFLGNLITILIWLFSLSAFASLFVDSPVNLINASALGGFFTSILAFWSGILLFIAPYGYKKLDEDAAAAGTEDYQSAEAAAYLSRSSVGSLAPMSLYGKISALVGFLWGFSLILTGHWFVGFMLIVGLVSLYLGIFFVRSKTKDYIKAQAKLLPEKKSLFPETV